MCISNIANREKEPKSNAVSLPGRRNVPVLEYREKGSEGKKGLHILKVEEERKKHKGQIK